MEKVYGNVRGGVWECKRRCGGSADNYLVLSRCCLSVILLVLICERVRGVR